MLPIEAITEDYDRTLSFIDKCDDHMFKIKNWALVTSSAVIAFSISRDKDAIVLVNLVLLPAFIYLELIYKSFQDSAIEHTTELSARIDRYLADPSAPDLLVDYAHGFGRKLKYPAIKRVFFILRNKNRRHILNFYGLLLFFSMGAGIVGSMTKLT
jgi:hypothetical protein